MNSQLVRALGRLWPRTLFHRLALILFSGLLVAHVLNFKLVMHERAQVAETLLADSLATDVATTVALLERVPPAERSGWFERLQHRHYRYSLLSAQDKDITASADVLAWTTPLAHALGPAYRIRATRAPNTRTVLPFRLHLHLLDGTPLTVELSSPASPHTAWVQGVMTIQLIMLVVFTWIAVKLATRPLVKLAQAADALGPDFKNSVLAEEGPQEVVRAAVAFNAMQRRMAGYLAERIQILAAISHDLQTPMTRLRLRIDLMEDNTQKNKLHNDLNAMQALVEQGIAYARSAQDVTEIACRTDLDALLDSLVCDYRDAGHTICLTGHIGQPLMTRPHTLRRIIANLADNALKFGDATEIHVETTAQDRVYIAVCDRGPGIPEAEMNAVLQPYYRIESSRNRAFGGTGLGLAIAHQLTLALGGTLRLSNRDSGGLEAHLSLPIVAAPASILE